MSPACGLGRSEVCSSCNFNAVPSGGCAWRTEVVSYVHVCEPLTSSDMQCSHSGRS